MMNLGPPHSPYNLGEERRAKTGRLRNKKTSWQMSVRRTPARDIEFVWALGFSS